MGEARDEHADAVARLLAGAHELVDDAGPELAVVRDPGRRPARDEDPLNAIVCTCSVCAPEASGPLAGMRLAVKDSIAVAGLPLSCGSAALEGFVPSADSEVAARLIEAGAEIVAVTNMDDMAVSGAGDSSFYGPVLNPFDPGRTAGGSSGGSAASLWYEGIDGSLGGDQAGSIRIPASWCGVIGFKPTRGLVPCAGVVGSDRWVDSVGPLGRSTAVAAQLLGVIAARDYTAAVEGPPFDLRELRIAVLNESFAPEAGVDSGVAEAVHRALDQLGDLGASITHASIPAHLDAPRLSAAMALTSLAALFDEHPTDADGREGCAWPALTAALRRDAEGLSPYVTVALAAGRLLRRKAGGRGYRYARARAQALADDYDRALQRADLIALPTTPTAARPPPSGTLAERLDIGWSNSVNTCQANLTGHPAISLPVAVVDGLPVGLMLVAAAGQDALLLSAARVYEREFGWQPSPPDRA